MIDKHVYSVGRLDIPVAIPNWQRDFTLDRQFPCLEFRGEARLISGFQHSRAKFSMNLNATIDDNSRDSVDPAPRFSIHPCPPMLNLGGLGDLGGKKSFDCLARARPVATPIRRPDHA